MNNITNTMFKKGNPKDYIIKTLIFGKEKSQKFKVIFFVDLIYLI
jgi:hypothetical protein